MSGVRAFRKSFFDPEDITWVSLNARLSRYSIFQGFYDNDAYDNVHTWAANLKVQYGLYESVRAISSPGFTIGDFYKNHIWGGVLSPEAKDEGAIPIETTNKGLRDNIADLFKWSQWGKNRNIFVLKGTIYGDCGLRVVDDIARNRVYLEVVDPSMVADIEMDVFGNVRGYTLEYDIDLDDTTVTYKEIVERDGQYVVYRTYKNDSPFAYPSNVDRTGTPREEWREAYTFTPFVWLNHIPTGSIYGNSELFAGLSKFREIDNQVSMLSDQVKNTIVPQWFLTGATADSITYLKTTATKSRPEPWREKLKLLAVENDKAKFEPKLAKIDIDKVITYLKQLDDYLIRDYPELALHRFRTEGNAVSGRALRIAQMPAEAKVLERRTIYDTALKTAIQMCLSIGGMRGIYKGVNLDSYAKGDLDFEINDREVFKIDPQDQSEMNLAFWSAADKAKLAGADLEGYLRSQGWEDAEIEEVLPEEEEQPTATVPVMIQEEDDDRRDEVYTGRPG